MSCIEQYLHNVESELVCRHHRRKRILQQLASDIDAFAEQHGNTVSVDELETEFGHPHEVAKVFLCHEDTSDIRKRLDIKKAVIISVLCVLFTALAVFAGYLTFDNARKEEFIHGYEKETIVYSEQEVPDFILTPSKNDRVY